MAVILVLDLGTSYLKASLFEGPQCIAISRCAMPVKSPSPGRCEIDLVDLRTLIVDGVATLRDTSPDAFARSAAVTFATQANSVALLDHADRPLTPLIQWHDTRARDDGIETDDLEALPEFRRVTGVPSLTHQFMPAKLRWLQGHAATQMQDARRVCQISDYVTHWLTGQFATDAGTAGLTGLVDTQALTWWASALERLGIPEAMLPRIVRAGTDLGPLSPPVAEVFGLPLECRYVVGCLDQHAGAIGAGCVEDGMLVETTGTVLATARCSTQRESGEGAGIYRGPGPDPDTDFQMCFSLTGGSLLEQYRNTLADRPDFAELQRAAEQASAEESRTVVVPAFEEAGSADACLAALTPDTPRGLAVRAIMQAVSDRLALHVDLLCGATRPTEIRAAGGGARSDYWLQMKADTLRLPVAGMQCEEPTSLGASMLAARALGAGSLRDLARRWCVPRRTFLPTVTGHNVGDAAAAP